MKLFTSVFIVLFLSSACHLGQNKTEANEKSTTTQTNKKMTIVPIMAENNSVLAGAFMLPQGWKGRGDVYYQMYSAIAAQVYLEASSGNLKLMGQNLGVYFYSEQMAIQDQYIQQNGMPSSLGPYFKAPMTIENYTEQFILPKVHPDYRPTDSKRLYNFKIKPDNNNEHILLVSFVNQNNPDNIAFLISSIFYSNYPNGQLWQPIAYFVEGTMSDSNEMYNTVKLIKNTIQFNPVFTSSINQINQKMTAQQKEFFRQQQHTMRGMSDHFFNTLHQVQRTSSQAFNSTSEQFSDMILGVESYQVPGQNDTYKMPAEYNYHYTNDMGDFLSTDNPLFNPNTQLDSYYNWTKMQKKY